MPKRIQNFARSALVKPVTINVGRAGAASMNVIQEVEYVKQEAKIVYLLECLQKTPPPVLIFAEKKRDVDAIHEYLLIKGVEAVAIHGGIGSYKYISLMKNIFLIIACNLKLLYILLNINVYSFMSCNMVLQ